MDMLNQFKRAMQSSGKLLQKYATEYIAVDASVRQLVLKPKAVALLCQQVVNRVEPLKQLEPDVNEGLIATFEHQPVEVKVHFTPEKIIFNGDKVEGHLRLLDSPQFETDSWVYRALISGWQTFLGGRIPNQRLPEGVRVEADKVYYQFPKSEVRLLNALFQQMGNQSSLELSLKQSELRIKSSIAVDWSDLNLQDLIQVFGATPKSN